MICDPQFTSQLRSKSVRALFKMADSSDEVTFDVTWSEIARAVLLRVFKRISPVLGAHVRSAYQEVYGEDGWLTAGKDCLSRRMLAKIEKTPDVLLHDIFIMTELMAARLDRVFLGRWFRGVVGASHHSALLQSLSADVDCVSRTRTWLFHGVDVSIGEVYRCVESVVRLVTRLPLNVCQHFIDELEGDLQVCLVRARKAEKAAALILLESRCKSTSIANKVRLLYINVILQNQNASITTKSTKHVAEPIVTLRLSIS